MKASTRARNPGSPSMADPCAPPGRMSSRLSVDSEAAYRALASPTNGSSFSEAPKNVGVRSRATACKALSGPKDAGAERLTTAAGADAGDVVPVGTGVGPGDD